MGDGTEAHRDVVTHSGTLGSYIQIWKLNPDLSGTNACCLFIPLARFQFILCSLTCMLPWLFCLFLIGYLIHSELLFLNFEPNPQLTVDNLTYCLTERIECIRQNLLQHYYLLTLSHFSASLLIQYFLCYWFFSHRGLLHDLFLFYSSFKLSFHTDYFSSTLKRVVGEILKNIH